METINILKTLSRMASEFGFTPKTLTRHIRREDRLKDEIKPGIQTPRKQKLIYDVLGYPPGVNRKDYEFV